MNEGQHEQEKRYSEGLSRAEVIFEPFEGRSSPTICQAKLYNLTYDLTRSARGQ